MTWKACGKFKYIIKYERRGFCILYQEHVDIGLIEELSVWIRAKERSSDLRNNLNGPIVIAIFDEK